MKKGTDKEKYTYGLLFLMHILLTTSEEQTLTVLYSLFLCINLTFSYKTSRKSINLPLFPFFFSLFFFFEIKDKRREKKEEEKKRKKNVKNKQSK